MHLRHCGAIDSEIHREINDGGYWAKSLFELAAEARHDERLGDAIRLYEAGSKLVPNDTDGLLALGDIRRDLKDYDAARRAYEIVQRSGGWGAGIARDRLAGLPTHQDTGGSGHK